MSTPLSFSQRFTTLSSELSPLAHALQMRQMARLPIFNLTDANPSSAGIPLPEFQIFQSLSLPNALRYQPHPFGMLSARQAIAAYYQALGKHIQPEQVVLTTGSSEAMGFLLKLLCDPGDSIATPAPGYPLFDYLAELENVDVFRYRLRFASNDEEDPTTLKDWSINFNQLDAAWPNRCKALICVAPNNPTGYTPTSSEWSDLDTFAAEKNSVLIVDEVFRPYRLDGQTSQPLKAGNAPLFTLNGFSKLLGLPQLKLGWIIVEGPEAWLTAALAKLEIITDTYLTVATPIQNAVPSLLQMESLLRERIQLRISENLNFALSKLRSHTQLLPCTPRAGWYLPLQLTNDRDSSEFALELLQTKGVYLHPGDLFDFAQSNHLVISLLTDPEIFQEGIRRLLDRRS